MDFKALRNVMATLWRPVKGLFIKELEFNKYIFQFIHDLDISRVIEGTTWTFNNIPLIQERLQDGENSREIVLNTMAIKIQVYDLKIRYIFDKILTACGDYIR